MSDSDRASEWYDGPDGKQKWIADAESIEEFVKRAFEAGWDARNEQINRLAVSLEGERELPGEPFRAKVPPFEVPGPIPGLDYRRMTAGPARTAAKAAAFRQMYGGGGELLAGPPPVTRIEDYEYPPTADMEVLPDRYTPTEKVPALPGDTNPGFKVPKEWPPAPLEHVQTVWDGREAADG